MGFHPTLVRGFPDSSRRAAGFILWLLLGSVLASLYASNAAYACSCSFSDDTFTVDELEAGGVAIVRGRAVVRERFPTGFVYEFEVEELLLGTMPDRVGIAAGHGGGDCGFDIPLGESQTLVVRPSLSRVQRITSAPYSADICLQSLKGRVRDLGYWLKRKF